MKLSFEVPFDCPDSMMPHLLRVFAGEYDVPYYPTGRPTILDIGANTGAFSLWASHRWPGALIHAYEPHPDSFALLAQNVAHCPLIHAHQVAVGAKGLRPLFDGINNPGEASFYDYEVPIASRIARLVNVIDPLTLPIADILKIDTEGAEMEILPPLIAAGRAFSAVMVEYHRVEYRRLIDQCLEDYVLTSLTGNYTTTGTVCYVHKGVNV